MLLQVCDRYVLHDSHDSRLDAEASRIVVLLLRLSSLSVAFDLVAATDYANLDLDKFPAEAFVEREPVGWLDIFRHWLFDQDARLRRHGERLQVPDQIAMRDICLGLDLLKGQIPVCRQLVEKKQDDHAVRRHIEIMPSLLERPVFLHSLRKDCPDVC